MAETAGLAIQKMPSNPSEGDVDFNAAMDLLDAGTQQITTINFSSDADLTLSTSGSIAEWQYGTIKLTDTGVVLTTGRNVIVPDNQRFYKVINSTAQTLTVKTSGGGGIAVAASANAYLQCDGADVIDTAPSANDADAIHLSVAGEISTLATVTVASGDYIIIEDVSDSNNKKKILASDLLGAGTDAAAIHDNVAAEISAVTNVAAAPADHLIIEDDSDSDNKKSTTVEQLRASTSYSLTGTALDTGSGDMAYKTFSGNTTITDSLSEGQGILVEFSAGSSYTITWPTTEWAAGSAPTLTAKDLIVFFKLNSTLYGVYLGSPS